MYTEQIHTFEPILDTTNEPLNEEQVLYNKTRNVGIYDRNVGIRNSFNFVADVFIEIMKAFEETNSKYCKLFNFIPMKGNLKMSYFQISNTNCFEIIVLILTDVATALLEKLNLKNFIVTINSIREVNV